MKKKIISLVFMVGLFFSLTNQVYAVGLPGENDPFWIITNNLHDPMDTDCYNEALAEYSDVQYAGAYGDGTAAATGACGALSAMLNLETTLQNSGISTNLFNNSDAGPGDDGLLDNDWRSINNLYFEMAGVGKIQFTQSINFMDYDFLTFLSTLTSRMSMSQGEIGLDADIVGGLSGYGAVLTMYNAGDFDDPEILVNDEEDDAGVVSGLSYDPNSHNIVFNAAHFTTFKATEKNTVKKPRITNIDIEKTKNSLGQNIVKITMTGKNFKRNTEFKLGGKLASKVSYKNSKKVIVTFKSEKLIQSGKTKFKLKAINNHKTGEYRNALKITNLL